MTCDAYDVWLRERVVWLRERVNLLAVRKAEAREEKSLGQIAHEAFHAKFWPDRTETGDFKWDNMEPKYQDAWRVSIDKVIQVLLKETP